MKRLSIPSLLALALVATACERHSASSLPSHGAHAAGEHAAGAEHAPATPAPAAAHAEAPAPQKDAPAKEPSGGATPKFFEPQPGK